MKKYSHTPPGYECPFCQVTAGVDRPGRGTKQRDVVYRNDHVTAFIATMWWPNNKGQVLVVPNVHFENIFDLPVDYAAEIHRGAQLVARAMKQTYNCHGISTWQHNEPEGNQDVWHYHLHVYPRYTDDQLYLTAGSPIEPKERQSYADRLRNWMHTKVSS